MRSGRRAIENEGRKLNKGKVVLVLFIIILIVALIFGIKFLVEYIKNKNTKDELSSNVNDVIDYSGTDSSKTIDEILNEFGGEVVEQVKQDTYYIKKDGTEYTAYLDGEISEGRIVPWDGKTSSKPAVDDAGNMNVYTASELKWIADQVISGQMNFSGVTITLRNNIDLGARKNDDGTWSEDYKWTPIIGFLDEISTEKNSDDSSDEQAKTDESDTIQENLKRFSGILQGNGVTIRGLYINSDKRYQGLFGYSSGTITNINIKNSSIKGGEGTGALVGLNEGRIVGCTLENVEVEGKEKVGGIVGINMTNSSIENCTTSENNIISSDKYVGGIAGYVNNNSNISNSSNKSIIKGKEYVGGIAGISFYGTIIKESYNQSENITGDKYVGGIVGYSSSQLEHVYSLGRISANSYVGGLVGVNYEMGNITDSYNSGEIIVAEDNAGGITGLNNSNISNCYNAGKIDASKASGIKVGGICGQNASECYIYTSYNIGNIITSEVANGLVGVNFGDVNNSFYLDSSIKISPKNDELKKSEEDMKNSILTDLGESFVKDTKNINSGYPVLSWQ